MPRRSDSKLRIIALLSGAPQRTVQAIADRVGLSRPATSDHLRDLIADGRVVQGYTVAPSPPRAFLMIGKPRKSPHGTLLADWKQIQARLVQAFPYVRAHHLVTGDKYDWIAELSVPPDSEQFGLLLEDLHEMVEATETFVSIATPRSGTNVKKRRDL